MALPKPFVVFEGTLEDQRIGELFSQRSWSDRAVEIGIWSLGALIALTVGWVMGAGGKLPEIYRWVISTCVASGILVCGFIQQFSGWHSRRWKRWNSHLLGKYRIELFIEWIDLQTAQLALRIPYGLLARVDSGLSWVRIGLDLHASRALMLPLADAKPTRTVREIEEFVKQHMQLAKSRPLDQVRLSDDELPLPMKLASDPLTIHIQGPQRLKELIDALEGAIDNRKTSRVVGAVYAMMAVAFVALMILLTAATLTGRQMEFEHWVKAVSVGIFLLCVAYATWRRRRLRAEVQADPYAEAGQLSGWISPGGLAVYYACGSVALTWDGCDSFELHENRMTVRFWGGDFVVLGRHMFPGDFEFQQATDWVSERTKPIA